MATAQNSASAPDEWTPWQVWRVHIAAYLAAWLVVLGFEYILWEGIPHGITNPLAWAVMLDLDTLLGNLLLLVAAPFAWRMRGFLLMPGSSFARRLSRVVESVLGELANRRRGTRLRAAFFASLCAAVSLGSSLYVASFYKGLPPAYHDEYSYLFQARTFLAGRTWFPSHESPRLFDQLHVLNEGRFASRYFPGAGVWMAPWVAIGHPYWGHWFAGALIAALVFFTGRELAGDVAGLIAGLLTGLSPGMALFGNLLLAHFPTLVGLGVFLVAYLRMLRFRSVGWAIVSGTGLAYAALCRPMTAAGVSLPFGIYFVYWVVPWNRLFRQFESAISDPQRGLTSTSRNSDRLKILSCESVALLAAMGIPLVIGGAVELWFNRAVTGDMWLSPYSLYTNTYTPRHVFGFNNRVRGEAHLGPRVIDQYDRWAENLDGRLALTNLKSRWISSWLWTLGLIPLAISLAAGLACWGRLPVGTRLVLASIISLHAVHIPYWYDGIMHWHYVFESGPLWLLWLAAVTSTVAGAWFTGKRSGIAFWWGGCLFVAVLTNYALGSQRTSFWASPLRSSIMNDVAFPRIRHGAFHQRIAEGVRELPALVLVDEDPSEIHLNYISNDPALNGPILTAHYLPGQVPLGEVKRLFPDRHLHLYKAKSNELLRLE